MTAPSPFDHERDAVLGEALRQILDAGDASAFVGRVMSRAGAARWDVLAGWARPGIAAALAAAMAAGFLVGRIVPRPPSLEEALVPSEAAVLESQGPPDAGVAFAVFDQ
ncbi:MAG: hypothetical protein ACREMR_08910 [Gemmatimonadales bacterium]